MLKVENLNVYYGMIHAIKDISLEVKQGEKRHKESCQQHQPDKLSAAQFKKFCLN